MPLSSAGTTCMVQPDQPVVRLLPGRLLAMYVQCGGRLHEVIPQLGQLPSP